jgi:hypothetical protein
MELLLVLGVLFVLSCIPPLVLFLRSRRRFSGARLLRCPETKRVAVVRLDAAHAGATSLIGDTELRVKSCSRWDGAIGHCHEDCLRESEPLVVDSRQSA